MANYKNSLGESELFGRMTAGFAKICESVQSGKFVRDEMGVICESVCEDDENAGAAPEGETADAGAEGATQDAGTEGATQDADVANATPEQINGSVSEGIVGKTLGTIGGATVGSAIGGALGCPVAGGIAGGIAGASLTEGCGGKNKKPMKKLIPEGCCGGKAKKVLKESYHGETDTVEGVVKSLKASDPSDELLIRDGFHHALYPTRFESKPKDAKSGRLAYNALYVTRTEGDPMTVGTLVSNLKTSKVPEQDLIVCDMENKRTYRVEFVDRKVMVEGPSCTYIDLKLKSGVEESVNEEVQKLCKTCGNPLDETGTCQDCQGYSPVKEGEGDLKAALKANAQANKEKVAQAIRDGKAVGIVKEGLDDRKGADKITKDDVFGMLVNLLEQIRDGVNVEEVTANPDMEEFDDYSLDEVLELAKKYEV